MSSLERGMVDPNRSFLWNLWHYRRGRELRVWSSAHDHMHNRIMRVHDAVILAILFFAVGLIGGLTQLLACFR